MNKKIKVVASPFNPSLEIADKIVVKLHVPQKSMGSSLAIIHLARLASFFFACPPITPIQRRQMITALAHPT